MAKRKSISKKVRFEVFKRDSFTCQYCGKSAPDVILHVDHISPVSKGGDNDILNLITACRECNSGKSDRELSDDSAIVKQRQQLEDLNERREQLELMLKWREGLKSVDEMAVNAAKDAWEAVAVGYYLNETGVSTVKKHIKKYGLSAVLDAIELAGEKYIKIAENGEATDDSVHNAWKKIGGILYMKSTPDIDRKLYYIRGILRNRCYVNEAVCMSRLREAAQGGADPEEMEVIAKTCRSWSEFWVSVDDLIQEDSDG